MVFNLSYIAFWLSIAGSCWDQAQANSEVVVLASAQPLCKCAWVGWTRKISPEKAKIEVYINSVYPLNLSDIWETL